MIRDEYFFYIFEEEIFNVCFLIFSALNIRLFLYFLISLLLLETLKFQGRESRASMFIIMAEKAKLQQQLK